MSIEFTDPGYCKSCGSLQWDKKQSRSERPGYRGTFMLLSGHTMDLTLCDSCTELDLDVIWNGTLKRWQNEGCDKAHLAAYAHDNNILALLFKQRWKDVV